MDSRGYERVVEVLEMNGIDAHVTQPAGGRNLRFVEIWYDGDEQVLPDTLPSPSSRRFTSGVLNALCEHRLYVGSYISSEKVVFDKERIFDDGSLLLRDTRHPDLFR